MENLYFPLFYKYYDITASMSDEDFGKLVRLVLLNMRGDRTEIPDNLLIAYNFIIDAANRVFAKRGRTPGADGHKKQASKSAPPPKYSNFDPEEAFKNALERNWDYT